MAFLFLNQFFPPDSAPTGHLLFDLAKGLAAKGDDVAVICSRSSYAGCQGTTAHDPGASHPGVRVIRVSGLPFSRGPVARLSSWASFFAGAFWHGLHLPQPDIVLTLTTPPLLALVGNLLRRRGARHIIWEMDVYPDVATVLGALRPGSWLDRLIGAIADHPRRRAHAIIALGPCMRNRLIARGIPPGIIHIAENWADGSQIRPVPPVSDGRLKILYSGNLGLAHDTETITEGIMWLAEDSRFSFTFAGGGPRRKALEDVCRRHRVRNVAFEPYKDASALSQHFASCDIGLVTQNPATLGCVVPSKTYALMAAARPILFIGPREATPALNIERFRSGWQIDPGDVNALVDLLNLLADGPELVRAAGRRAYAAFQEHYDLPHGVARICEILKLPAPVPAMATPGYSAD